MPRVYITQEQRKREQRMNAIRKLIKGKLAEEGVKGKDAAEHIGLTPSAFSNSVKSCSLSLLQFCKLHEVLHFNEADLRTIFS